MVRGRPPVLGTHGDLSKELPPASLYSMSVVVGRCYAEGTRITSVQISIRSFLKKIVQASHYISAP